MGRDVAGQSRPIERLVGSIASVEIVDGAGLRRGHYYVAGERLIIMVPEEFIGVDVREGMIARQALLVAIRALGDGGARAAFTACAAALWEGQGVGAERSE